MGREIAVIAQASTKEVAVERHVVAQPLITGMIKRP
jgi:hypothetical protein